MNTHVIPPKIVDDVTAASPAIAEPALTNAERQRRYRQRKRNDHPPVTQQTVTGDVTVLCAQQAKIEIAFSADGDAIIKQACWPDEDQTVVIARENIGTFIDRLTDALGIPGWSPT